MSAETLRIAAWYARARWLTSFRSRPRLERFQRRILRSQLRFLRRRSAWFGRLPAGDLSDLPVLDKASMMAHFNELVTVPVDRDEAMALAIAAERSRTFDAELHGCTIGLSTGTSGHRGLFLVSPRERAQWAGTVLARTLPRLRGQRIALFLRAGGDLYETVGSRTVRFEYFDTFRPVAEHVDRLTEFNPTILVGPPSVLRGLVDAVADGSLRISPAKVYSVAEVLTPLDEERIREGFGVPLVHQIYQCTEGFLGHTCEAGTLHLNEDIVHVEREHLDERRFVPVITDFRRRTQPIVRYRMGDVLVLRESPCPCGSAMTALERIEGREDDVLRLAGRDGTTVPVYADLVTRAVAYADGVVEYRVVQTGAAEVRVELDPPSGDAADAVVVELRRLFAVQGVADVRITVAPFEHDPSRKLRRVERLP